MEDYIVVIEFLIIIVGFINFILQYQQERETGDVPASFFYAKK